jgi:hypothetical protein
MFLFKNPKLLGPTLFLTMSFSLLNLGWGGEVGTVMGKHCGYHSTCGVHTDRWTILHTGPRGTIAKIFITIAGQVIARSGLFLIKATKNLASLYEKKVIKSGSQQDQI